MEIFDYDTSCCCRASAVWKGRTSGTPRQFGPPASTCPVVPANMKDGGRRADPEWLAANGVLSRMHRFDIDNSAYARQCATRGGSSSVSSGVKPATARVYSLAPTASRLLSKIDIASWPRDRGTRYRVQQKNCRRRS